MKAQVVKCCHQFLEMQEEDIQPYLAVFVKAIWGLLVACTSRSGQDNLALAAIAFLTTVGRSTHHSLFASGETLQNVRRLWCYCAAILYVCSKTQLDIRILDDNFIKKSNALKLWLFDSVDSHLFVFTPIYTPHRCHGNM